MVASTNVLLTAVTRSCYPVGMAKGKQIRIDPESYRKLKEMSRKSGASMVHIVSRLVDKEYEQRQQAEDNERR